MYLPCPMCVPNPSSYVLQYTNTHTFQEYLYRFVALAAGGWAAGPWQRGRSRSKGKTSLISLAVVDVCLQPDMMMISEQSYTLTFLHVSSLSLILSLSLSLSLLFTHIRTHSPLYKVQLRYTSTVHIVPSIRYGIIVTIKDPSYKLYWYERVEALKYSSLRY